MNMLRRLFFFITGAARDRTADVKPGTRLGLFTILWCDTRLFL